MDAFFLFYDKKNGEDGTFTRKNEKDIKNNEWKGHILYVIIYTSSGRALLLWGKRFYPKRKAIAKKWETKKGEKR